MRGSQPWRSERARVLRSGAASAEARLWSKLRSRRFNSLKFVRQAPIGPYFVDFLCRERSVIVEVDGGTHGTDAELTRDGRRARELRRLGYRIFRVHNIDVYDNLDGVLDTLLAFIEEDTVRVDR